MANYQIYKHTDPNDKAYIGITANRKRRDADHRQCRKVHPFYEAIREHGWDNFTHETLMDGLTKEQALRLEKELIEQFNTLYPLGHNLHPGGEILKGEIFVNEAFLRERPLNSRNKKDTKAVIVKPKPIKQPRQSSALTKEEIKRIKEMAKKDAKKWLR